MITTRAPRTWSGRLVPLVVLTLAASLLASAGAPSAAAPPPDWFDGRRAIKGEPPTSPNPYVANLP